MSNGTAFVWFLPFFSENENSRPNLSAAELLNGYPEIIRDKDRLKYRLDRKICMNDTYVE